MKAVIQRVQRASVTVDGKITGSVEKGYLLLLGVMEGDSEADAEIMARKTAALRIFTDENDKMNQSVLDVNGGVLVVSQFTLCADCKKGNRPSFSASAPPDEAKRLYEYFCGELRKNGVQRVETGVFGAHMDVSLVNDGPVTILYDSTLWHK